MCALTKSHQYKSLRNDSLLLNDREGSVVQEAGVLYLLRGKKFLASKMSAKAETFPFTLRQSTPSSLRTLPQ